MDVDSQTEMLHTNVDAQDHGTSALLKPINGTISSHPPSATKPLPRALGGSAEPNREMSTPRKAMANKYHLASDLSSDDSGDELSRPNTTAVGFDGFPTSELSTGLCYDPRMRFHCETDPPKDRNNYHPEDPRRIQDIYLALCEAGLAEDKAYRERFNPSVKVVSKPLVRIPVRHAQREEVCLVHLPGHYDYMQRTSCKSRLLRVSSSKL